MRKNSCYYIYLSERSLINKPENIMKILIITIGSRGDVNPYLVVGRELKKRGHDVVFCAAGFFQELVEGFGFRFVPHLSREEYMKASNNPDLWNYHRALPTFSREALVPNLRKIYSIIKDEQTEDFMVLSTPFAFASKIAEEKLGIKLAQLHLSPLQFRTFLDTSQLGKISMNSFLPGWCKRFVWCLIDRFIIDPHIIGELNRFRTELGLKPVKRVLNGWWFSKHFNAIVFSKYFASRQQGWPEPSEIFDFLCFDGNEELPDEAAAFLKNGDRPVVFTPGTAFNFGKKFFEESLKTLKALNLRGVFLTHNKSDIPENIPDYVYACKFLPLGLVLPRCAAIVHHGGVGTLAQAAKAGIPQLVFPMAFDQFDNAFRIHNKKLGTYIHVKKYKSAILNRKLKYVLYDKKIAAGCAAVSKMIDSEKALDNLVTRIEEI